MSVSSLHPLYIKRSSQWKTIRDCIEGEDAIKSAGETYLPKNSGWTKEQYDAYKKRARWNNYTAQNLDGLHGLIFRRNPIITAKGDEFKKEGFLDNIDRKGTSLYQFLSDTVYDVMQTSYGGYLVDFPPVKHDISLGKAKKLGIRPYLRYYAAESIINWGYSVINGLNQLSFVVLEEYVEDYSEDEFSPVLQKQYRVLDLRSGIYKQILYSPAELTEEDKKAGKKEEFTKAEIPVIINGKTLDYIPFVTIPSVLPEKPMFYDLAMCNIGHYQKSADYENGVHLTTIPTGYVTGHRRDVDPETEEPEDIHLGWDSFLIFPEEQAKVGNLSFSGVGLVHSETALKQACADMTVLGSRLLISENGSSESADSAKIHRSGENARLATFAKNISDKVTKVLQIMADWSGIKTKIQISLCTDYDTLAFDPNALNAIANLAEAKKIPIPAVYYNLKNGEYLPPDMTLESFGTLLQMEEAGFTPTEIVIAYNAILNNETVDIPDVKDNKNNAENPKEDVNEPEEE